MVEELHPVQEPVLGRRERNKQKVRNRLYAAALELFSEKGYEHTSVDEIAEAADVARGTFFNHFQRKEDLISAWGEERRERLKMGFAAARTDQHECLPLALDRCMRILAEINEGERKTTQSMLTAWVKAGRPLQEEPYLTDIFEYVIEGARRHGEIPASVSPRRAGHVLRDVYFGTLYRWCQEPQGAFELRTELHAACDIVLNGINGTTWTAQPTASCTEH
jgi:AcrR family transcriptional regulator